MRWRLLRRCLLFTLLGLVTAVAVAWGLSVRGQLSADTSGPVAVGAALKDGRPLCLVLRRRLGVDSEEWIVAAQSSLAPPELARVRPSYLRLYRALGELGAARSGDQVSIRNADELAAAGPPAPMRNLAAYSSTSTRESAGWPQRALRYSFRNDVLYDPADETAAWHSEHSTKRGAIEAPWLWRWLAARPRALGTVYLPIEPRPGLLLNTIFYALLWALLVLAPGALRRRVRRVRGRCPRCGYSLRGQPAPGCPECGQRRESPAPALSPA